jgi:hypothetical protein
MDREKREQMGNFSRITAAAHSWEEMASRVAEVYQSVNGRGFK